MSSCFALTRLFDSGAPDPDFGRDGRVITGFVTSADDVVRAVAVDHASRIVAAGTALVGGGGRMAVARYTPDGLLDLDFSGDGKAVPNFWSSRNECANAVVVLDDDRVVLGGWAEMASGRQFALARYTPAGRLDRTFDRDGKVLTGFGRSRRHAVRALGLDREGRLFAAGSVEGGDRAGFRVALACYTEHGGLDPRFGAGGLVDWRPEAGPARARSLAVDREGRLLVAGEMEVGGSARYLLARFNRDGSLDTRFGEEGIAPATVAAAGSAARAVAPGDDGHIHVGGTASIDGSDRIMIGRHRPDGAADTGFGDRGSLLGEFRGAASSRLNALVVDPAGRIVVAGQAGAERFAVARYLDDGRQDAAFGDEGRVFVEFRRGAVEEATALAFDSRRRIVVAGYTRTRI